MKRLPSALLLAWPALALSAGCSGGETETNSLGDQSIASTTTEICNAPIEVGPCDAAMERFAFNPASGQCEPFTYGGCEGNDNNFTSRFRCERLCIQTAPTTCAGETGASCADEEYCRFDTDATCGSADRTGVCALRPQFCTEQHDPVCGCDGQTYGNACSARANGVDVASEGRCDLASAGLCEDQQHATKIIDGGSSFGFCVGKCSTNLTIEPNRLRIADPCDVAEVTVCTNDPDRACEHTQAALTVLGHDRARALAEALRGVSLQARYGCPDCADGGKSWIVVKRDGDQGFEVDYETPNPPAVIAEADAFVQTLIRDIRACRSTDLVKVYDDCEEI